MKHKTIYLAACINAAVMMSPMHGQMSNLLTLPTLSFKILLCSTLKKITQQKNTIYGLEMACKDAPKFLTKNKKQAYFEFEALSLDTESLLEPNNSIYKMKNLLSIAKILEKFGLPSIH